MSQSASVRARSAHPRPGARPVSPRGPRRVSGPARRPHAAPPAAAPRRATGAFERVRALPDHRVVDSLLRSQAWVWVIGFGLLGIVAMQVSLLKLNSGIGRAVETSATLERQNASLEATVARLSGSGRIEATADAAGMVMPPAGAVRYLTVRPGTDSRWAQLRMRPPSAGARALLANGGVVPGAPAATGTAPPQATTTTTAATTTPPAATAAAPAATTTAPPPTTTSTAVTPIQGQG